MRLTYAVSMIALLAFATPALADDYVIMKVNGQDVTSTETKKFWEGLFPAGQAPNFDTQKPEVKSKVLRAVMAEKLIYSDAVAHNVEQSPTVQKKLDEMKKKLVIQTYLDTKTNDSITDADLKKEYDSTVAAMKDEKEVKARHILVPTEQEAKDVRKKIDEGKSFEEVAREFSKDPGSAKRGGDLGYFTKDKMVPEFASAAFNLKKGEVSGPVKSPFGWHIIKVEDIRPIKAPAFAEVKDGLKNKLQEKRMNDFIGGVVKTADVKVFDAKGKEIPFEKNLPAEKPVPAVKADATAVDAAKADDAKSDKPATDAAKSDKPKSDAAH